MCYKIFNSKKCCISIWSSWYSILIVLIHVFIIRDRVAAILDLNKEMEREHGQIWRQVAPFSSSQINNSKISDLPIFSFPKQNINQEFTVRISLTCLSIFLLILFFVTSNKKIGNFSNDGVKLGRDFFGEKLHHHRKHIDSNQNTDSIISASSTGTKESCLSIFKLCRKIVALIWRHFLPINSILHLMSVILLLVQDLIYDQNAMIIKQINSLLIESCPSQNVTQCLIDILVNLKSDNQTENLFENSFLIEKLSKFKLELMSIILAYVTISIRYGSVFWYTNKTLAYAISSIGLFNALEQLFQLYIFFYISKQNLLNNLSEFCQAQVSVAIAEYGPIGHQTIFINDQLKLCIFYSFLSLSVISSLVPIYSFSYLKYKERFLIEENLFSKTSLEENSDKKITSPKTPLASKLDKNKFFDSDLLDLDIDVASQRNSCFNYCPHLIATLQLVVICALKLPFSYDLIIYFNIYKDHVLMVSIINEILHTIILLFIWLILTLKTEWQMHLRTSFSICHWTYHLKLNEKSREKYSLKTVSAQIDSQSDYFNSDTLYRNEIRKSSRNLLKYNRNSASVVPAYVRPENRLNRMSQPTYLSSSTPSSRFNIPQHLSSNADIPFLSSPNATQKNQSVPSSAYNQNVLYLKRPPASEYESRV